MDVGYALKCISLNVLCCEMMMLRNGVGQLHHALFSCNTRLSFLKEQLKLLHSVV